MGAIDDVCMGATDDEEMHAAEGGCNDEAVYDGEETHDDDASKQGMEVEQGMEVDEQAVGEERSLSGEATAEWQADEDQDDAVETETEDEVEGAEGRDMSEEATTVWNPRTREGGRGAEACFAEVRGIAEEVIAGSCALFSVEDVVAGLLAPLEQLPFRTGVGLTYTRRQDVPDAVAACPQRDEEERWTFNALSSRRRRIE